MDIIFEPGDRVEIVSGRHKGRDGTFYKNCSSAFTEWCRVKVDKTGREKEDQIQMIEKADLKLISKNMAKKTNVKEASAPTLQFIEIGSVTGSKLNPRKDFNEIELKELADSIMKIGLIQAITVRPITAIAPDPSTIKVLPAGTAYEIVCGERRYRASLIAGLETIPAVVRDLSDAEAMELMITENLQRKDVHPIEEANAFKFMRERMGYSIADAASKVGKPESYVVRRLQLVELIPELQEASKNGLLPIGHAEVLCRINATDQKTWHDNTFKGWHGAGTLRDLKQNISGRYELGLANAKFDTTITIGDIIPCTECPSNSSCNVHLFPDQQDKAICHNSVCFNAKTNMAFNVALEKVMQDPSIFLLDESYEADPLVKKLKADGHTILKQYNDYNNAGVREPALPEIPDLDDYDIEDYDSQEDLDAEYQKDLLEYQDELKEYESELADYEKSIQSLTKGFIIAGYNKGDLKAIKLSSKSTGATNAPQANNALEVIKQKEKLKRGRELDNEKVMKKLVDIIPSLPITTSTTAGIHEIEYNALIVLAYESLGYNQFNDTIKKELGLPAGFYAYNNGGLALFDAIAKASPSIKALIIRRALLNKFTSISSGGINFGVMMNLGKAWCPSELQKIELDQEGIRENREKKIEARIKELEDK